MTTDKLLPLFIDRTKITTSNGIFIGYAIDDKEGNSIWELNLCNKENSWTASYETFGDYVCLNPDTKKPYLHNYSNTPNYVLQNLYNFCIQYKFIEQ